MVTETASHQPSTPDQIKLIKGLPRWKTTLTELSLDGFNSSTVGQLHAAAIEADPEFVEQHPDISPLIQNELFLATLDALIKSRPTILLVELVRELDEAAEIEAEFSDFLSQQTTLGSYERSLIVKSCSPEEHNQVRTAIQLLQTQQPEGLKLIFTLKSLSAFLQNLILLNLSNVGSDLTLKILEGMAVVGADGRDFVGDERRIRKYGIDINNLAGTTFPLESTHYINRDAYQTIISHLSPSYISHLIGISATELSESSAESIVAIREQLRSMSRQW